MNRLLFLVALIVAAYIGAGAGAFVKASGAFERHSIAICETDSDCIEHCPPDEDCDGGPQS